MSDFPFTIVGFDLDGTLLDTSGDLAAAVNHALTAAGRPALPVGAIRPMIGGGSRNMLAQGMTATGGYTEDELDEAQARFMQQKANHHLEFLADRNDRGANPLLPLLTVGIAPSPAPSRGLSAQATLPGSARAESTQPAGDEDAAGESDDGEMPLADTSLTGAATKGTDTPGGRTFLLSEHALSSHSNHAEADLRSPW